MTATPTEASAPLPATVEELIRHRLSAALGGGRGALETALPTAVFVSWWLIAHDLKGAVIAAIVVELVSLAFGLALCRHAALGDQAVEAYRRNRHENSRDRR